MNDVNDMWNSPWRKLHEHRVGMTVAGADRRYVAGAGGRHVAGPAPGFRISEPPVPGLIVSTTSWLERSRRPRRVSRLFQ